MDEEHFNMQIRKFLKQVGVTSQREIEGAIRAAVDAGKISGDDTVAVKATLTIPSLGISHDIAGDIELAEENLHEEPGFE